MNYKGYTQYSEPETWLSVAYPTIYSIWRQVISSNTTTTLNMQLTCAICKVKSSSGQHYGVKMCEADKQFLKRSFHQRLQYPPCINEGSGTVCPPRPRGWCQICRLQTCLANPVNITMIRVGEKVKKSKKETKTREAAAYPTTNVSLDLNQQFQASKYYSSPDVKEWVSTLYTSPKATYKYLHYPIPYDMSSTDQPNSSFPTFDIEAEKLLVESGDDCPLDLTMNKVQVNVDDDVDEWFHQEVAFIELQTQQLGSYNFDISTLSSFESKSFSFSKREDLSGTESSILASSRSIANCGVRTTPFPAAESSYGVNKLSVNSTILGHALAQVQSSISMSSSLVNLSSVSDVLTEADDEARE